VLEARKSALDRQFEEWMQGAEEEDEEEYEEEEEEEPVDEPRDEDDDDDEPDPDAPWAAAQDALIESL